MALMMERVARTQLLARAVGPLRAIDPASAQVSHDFLHKPLVMNTTFAYYARRVLRQSGDQVLARA